MNDESNIKDNIRSLLSSKKNTKEVDDAIDNLLEVSQGNSDITEIMKWFEERRKACKIKTKEIGINELEKWKVDPKTGIISHDSGKFFSIIGVSIKGATDREVTSWAQPLMKQQECGILGLLAKRINGVIHYLLYAKYEPGNIHKLQLSPTLQATDSNLKLAHEGKKPRFAEYFEYPGKVLTSVVSADDGGRFYLKTNRNMIVEIPEDEKLEVPEEYIWVTLAQLKKLLKLENVVNVHVRGIISCL